MFGIDSGELLIIAVVALVVIGPKDLPRVMRAIGNFVGKARGMATHFRSGIDTMIRESELADMEKKWKEDNDRIMREHPLLPSPVDAKGGPLDVKGTPIESKGGTDWPPKEGPAIVEPWAGLAEAKPVAPAAPKANKPKAPPRRPRAASATGAAPPIPGKAPPVAPAAPKDEGA